MPLPQSVTTWPQKLAPIPSREIASDEKQSAVLVLPYGDPADPTIVFVEKTDTLRFHAGQIAFPGGQIEADDTSIAQAALREAWEEAGIKADSVEILGMLPVGSIPRSGFLVYSVVGWWLEPGKLGPTDPGEIAAVHTLKFSELADPANRVTWQHPQGFTGPGFAVGELFIWGFTAGVVDELLRLLGFEQPWDATKVTSIPKRFFREQK
ncbi:MAG: CoA pyrophosphatase [Propionibacteriaceae bacterium]|jgi:8-oxo-dGTP pyrophosphatase MutT (NUDIX family)|nr:CoA pyrophosphatase [Propionibacteriaceae bacterium]